MDYQIEGIPGFESRQVVVRSGGLFSGPKLLVDSEAVKGSWGKYTLRRNDGQEVLARLNNNFLDPIPQLIVGGRLYAPIPPLPWFQMAWAGAPILLLFVGGLIGALLGVLAAYLNTHIFRSKLQLVLKFVLTGLISGLTALIYLVLVAIFSQTVNR